MAKQFRDIISADFVNKTFTTLKVTNVDFIEKPGMHRIFYEGCSSPIPLTPEDFEQLCEDKIVELHHGEVAIRFA